MIATVFLSVLILALFLGNVFLSLTDPKRVRQFGQAQNSDSQAQNSDSEQSSLENGFVQDSVQNSFDQYKEDSALSFDVAAERERVRHLSKRIERLEQLLLKINNSKFVAQKLNGTNLYQRLKEFDQFKQNTKLEIAALRQRLDRAQPQKKRSKPAVPEISDEKLREIVFRASH